ncbi:hypothetical protein BDR22DRAFT_978225 [Usnea florida]
MALSSSSNGGAVPKVRSVERSNGGFNSHESRLLQGGAFFLIAIGIVVSTMGHKSRLLSFLFQIRIEGRTRERQSECLLAGR